MIKRSWVQRTLGEAEELQNAPAAPAAPAPEAEVEGELESVPDQGQTVQMLLSAWNSGDQQDVVHRLVYTPVSNLDMIQFIQQLPPEDARRLGSMMDEMEQSDDMPGEEGSPVNQVIGSPDEAPVNLATTTSALEPEKA